jgi:hypothetical protein
MIRTARVLRTLSLLTADYGARECPVVVLEA